MSVRNNVTSDWSCHFSFLQVPGKPACEAISCASLAPSAVASAADNAVDLRGWWFPHVGRAMQAAHVAQHEDGCSAYELSVSTDDPDSFVIYER